MDAVGGIALDLHVTKVMLLYIGWTEKNVRYVCAYRIDRQVSKRREMGFGWGGVLFI